MASALPRRDALSIVAAIKIDPQRRELYVEGQRDRLFLQWLTDGVRDANARLVEAQFVESAPIPGGERGRLLAFANAIEHYGVPIRIWIDADFDRVMNARVPTNVYMTDLRDLEGYCLTRDCLDKVLRLGLARSGVDAGTLLTQILREGRPLGLLRLLSMVDDLRLPFQDLELGRYCSWTAGSLSVDFGTVVGVLLQKVGTAGRDRDTVLERLRLLEQQHVAIHDLQLVHGKDVLAMLRIVTAERNLTPEQAGRMLWTSFERAFIPQHPELTRVVGFLRGDNPIP